MLTPNVLHWGGSGGGTLIICCLKNIEKYCDIMIISQIGIFEMCEIFFLSRKNKFEFLENRV